MKPLDAFIGLSINNYKVTAPIDEGTIGKVYRANSEGTIHDVRAIKFIPEDALRGGWENEINKVTKLRNSVEIVRYQSHGFTEVESKRYLWISWDYIDGESLFALSESKRLTITILTDVLASALKVLHACQKVDIQHADLHSRNILVEFPNPLTLNAEQRRIWITDFGYLSASMGKDQLDDFFGLARITKESLRCISYSALEGRDRQIYSRLEKEFIPQLLETDATEGSWVRIAKELHGSLENIIKSDIHSPAHRTRSIGDYLAAELIGDQFEEWRSLFVPDFIGRESLLERNPTILTGLRGCGKTMVFRRLTALYDAKLGSSEVPGSNTFLGFYINGRVVAEAFPWLPETEELNARSQVIHFYHSCWCLEILDWLEIETAKENTSINWLGTFFSEYFPGQILITSGGRGLVRHLQSFFSSQLEKSRLKARYDISDWELSNLRFLEDFAQVLCENVPSAKDKPLYLFLDDYSTPLVSSTLQRILNPIVFRRSHLVITKIATESIESFEPFGLNGKSLEESNDFSLIDCGVHVLTMPKDKNREHLSAIFKRRIDRSNELEGLDLNLKDILGSNGQTNTDLAHQIKGEEEKTEILYHGFEMFCNCWSGNMREMIRMFAEMVSETPKHDVATSALKVPAEVQNRVMRQAGGRYLSLLAAAINPSAKIHSSNLSDRSFGERLVQIAKAFQAIAEYELEHKTSKNQNLFPPKQARKIEITDVTHELPKDISSVYSGMLRYGLFIRDYRGKSVRGKAVPRLFLRSILIPFFTLTFSKRDHITLNWDDFCELLRNPEAFAKFWIKRDKEKNVELNSIGNHKHQDLPGLLS